MNDLEIEVLRALANGVNYFTGEKCENDSILNDPNIIRTLFNVCNTLSAAKSNDSQKSEFSCPDNIEDLFEFEKELSLTKIVQKVNLVCSGTKKLKQSLVKETLKEMGILKTIVNNHGGTRSVASDEAQAYGIYNVQRTTMYGVPYTAVVFNEDGQRFVLSVIKDMFK